MTYDFPADFFGPPEERGPDWPDHPDVRAAVEWFRSFIPEDEWRQRRIAAANRLYDAALSRIRPDDEKGRLFDEADQFGWFLFLAEAFVDHIHNYEPTFGSRVVSVFAAIGRNLGLLQTIHGVEERARRIVDQDRAQPNGALFELLVAACYARQGGEVVFVPEERGRRKTHDLDVTIHGVLYAVECKRMETGDYGDRERSIMRNLWSPCAHFLSKIERSVLGNVRFTVPLDRVPKLYLANKMKAFLTSTGPMTWNDGVSSGSLTDLDLTPLRDELSSTYVLQGSSRLMEIITGEYIKNRSFQQLLRVQVADNPRYIDDCDLAIVMRWESASDEAVDSKARDVFRKLVEASRQLPDDRRSIVHIGFEAVEGDDVERRRYQKIITNTESFDPQGKRLEYVYCHYFVPESPPDEGWAFDETVQLRGIRPEGPPPLLEQFLVMPPEAEERRGPHWRH